MGKSPLKIFCRRPLQGPRHAVFENAAPAATDPSVFSRVLRSISDVKIAMIRLA